MGHDIMKIIDSLRELMRSGAKIPTGGSPQCKTQHRELQETKILIAKILIDKMKTGRIVSDIREREFKVFSQFSDDGIIQYLIHHLQIEPSAQRFIEFGVENYVESNTRFLLVNNNWHGLVMDSSTDYIRYIQEDEIYWKHDLTAVPAFIDRGNINSLISQHQFGGEIGILSIDVDGNDYWIWQQIDVVRPIIVIVEYNSLFGHQHAITVPYDATFRRSEAHFSNLYYGCSLKALWLLAERKGYAFVGSNSNGNNAYFVCKDRLGNLRTVGVTEGYVESRFRESRDPQGRLSYLSGQARLRAIEEMTVYDLERECYLRIKDLPIIQPL